MHGVVCFFPQLVIISYNHRWFKVDSWFWICMQTFETFYWHKLERSRLLHHLNRNILGTTVDFNAIFFKFLLTFVAFHNPFSHHISQHFLSNGSRNFFFKLLYTKSNFLLGSVNILFRFISTEWNKKKYDAVSFVTTLRMDYRHT